MPDGRPMRKSQRQVNYVELGSSDDDLEEESQQAERTVGLLFTTADPRYVGKDTAEAGSVILNMDQVRQILRDEKEFACQDRTLWLTTSQMGWSICTEVDEVVSSADTEEGDGFSMGISRRSGAEAMHRSHAETDRLGSVGENVSVETRGAFT